MSEAILWRRVDRPGHEACRLTALEAGWPRERRGWRLEGSAVFAHGSTTAHHSEQQACRLDYVIVCDADWRTRSGKVAGWVGEQGVEVEISVDAAQNWRLNGGEVKEVAGCTDLDLNFSPSTNTLPIRRLKLAVGEEAAVRAAWLRFPSFQLEPLEQSYRRIDETTYRYESAGGRFVAELQVNAAGFVTRYPGFFEVEGA